MMAKNFYEQHEKIYAHFLEQLDSLLGDIDYSVYLRGSANKSSNCLSFRPWDIDLVLFSEKEIDYKTVSNIRDNTFYFNDRVLPEGYPYIDLRFFSNPSDNCSDKYLLYLLKRDSYVIKGIDNHIINNASKPNAQELSTLYSNGLITILIKYHRLSVLRNKDNEFSAKLKNIIKSIARCGCVLLLLREDVFTRDVNSGLDALHKYLMDDCFLKIKLPLESLDCLGDIDWAITKMLEDNRG